MTFAFGQYDGRVLVIAMSKENPCDDSWGQLLKFVDDNSWRTPRVVVFSDGGAPTASQRSSLGKIMKQYPETRGAVLVDSAIARGAVTALGWLYGNFTAFRRNGYDAACAYLELSESERQAVRLHLDRLIAIVRE